MRSGTGTLIVKFVNNADTSKEYFSHTPTEIYNAVISGAFVIGQAWCIEEGHEYFEGYMYYLTNAQPEYCEFTNFSVIYRWNNDGTIETREA